MNYENIEEPKDSDLLILYVEPQEMLKYALMEFGSALCANRRVIMVLKDIDLSKPQREITKDDLVNFPSISQAMLNHPNVILYNNLDLAIKTIKE